MASSVGQFDAYYKWLGIAPQEQPPHHYRLLGIQLFEADPEVIQSAADQRMSHVRTFQTGAHAAQSQQILNALAAARVCLLKPERKATYDAELRKRLEPPGPVPPPTPAAMPAAVVAPAARPVPVPVVVARPHVAPQPVVAPVVPAAVPGAVPMPAQPVAPDTPFVEQLADVTYVPRHRPTRPARRIALPLALLSVLIIGGAVAAVLWKQNTASVPPPAVTQASGPQSADGAPSPEHPPLSPAPAGDQPPVAPTRPTSPAAPANPPATAVPPAKAGPADKPATPHTVLPPVPRTQTRPRFHVVDDATPAFAPIYGQGWQRVSDEKSYQGGHHLWPHGQGPARAQWILKNLEPGRRYGVYARWQANDALANNARFTIAGARGESTGLTVDVDQSSPISDDAQLGAFHFHFLAAVTCDQGELRITLSQGGGQGLLADAVLVLPVADDPLGDDSAPLAEGPDGEMQDPDAAAGDPSYDAADFDDMDDEATAAAEEDDDADTADAAVAERVPAPSETEQAATRELIYEVFDTLKTSRDAAQRFEVADKLLEQAADSSDDTERYVLIDEARRLAVAAGQTRFALERVHQLVDRYELDRSSQVLQTMNELSPAIAVADRRQFCELSLEEANRAVAEDHYDEARQMLITALAVSKKTSDALLTRQITQRGKEVVDLAKAYEVVRTALEKLATDPDDREANLVVGRHQCFIRRDWSVGLPHLAKGAHEKLRNLAEQDLADPTDADERVSLADAWWQQAEADEPDRAAISARAGYWYRRALPELSGLVATKAERRLKELAESDPEEDSKSGKADSSPAALRVLLARVRGAVRGDKLVRSNTFGAQAGRAQFSDLPTGGGLLTGFNYAIRDRGRIVSLQPVYATTRGGYLGKIYGNPARGTQGQVVAPAGYAVGAVELYGDGSISGMTLVFMKITRTGLDPTDTQSSDLIGRRAARGFLGAFDARESEKLGGNGQPVVGIHGNVSGGGELNSLGLIQLAP